MTPVRLSSAMLALSCALVVDAFAADCTPITSVPYVVTSPGAYCVMGLLQTSQTTGAAIEIQADDVFLDFTHGAIDGLGGGIDSQAIGIHALDRNNISIFNGLIRGFSYGISLASSAPDFSGTGGHHISHVAVDSSRTVGIHVAGHGNYVYRNGVWSTGNAPFGSSVAIAAYGPGAVVHLNNIVETATTAADAGATDILVFGSRDCEVTENRMVNTLSADNQSVGVTVWSSPGCLVRDNEIDNRTASAPLDIGVWVIESRHVQTISNDMTNVSRHYVR